MCKHFGKLNILFLILFLLMLNSCKQKQQIEETPVKSDSLKTVETTFEETKTLPGTPIKYDSSKRYIFLTWDDAPQLPASNICKRIFETQNVKATFFMVGMHQFDKLRKIFVDSIRENYPQFLLANHGYTHGFRNNYQKFYNSPDSAVNDFLKAEKSLNIPVKIIRFPGNQAFAGKGKIKATKLSYKVAKKLDSMGYFVIGWDVEWEFTKGSIPKQTAEELLATVNKKFENGTTFEPNCVVILAHDRMFGTPAHAAELEKFIIELKKDPRNVFETIDHYPFVQNK